MAKHSKLGCTVQASQGQPLAKISHVTSCLHKWKMIQRETTPVNVLSRDNVILESLRSCVPRYGTNIFETLYEFAASCLHLHAADANSRPFSVVHGNTTPQTLCCLNILILHRVLLG